MIDLPFKSFACPDSVAVSACSRYSSGEMVFPPISSLSVQSRRAQTNEGKNFFSSSSSSPELDVTVFPPSSFTPMFSSDFDFTFMRSAISVTRLNME